MLPGAAPAAVAVLAVLATCTTDRDCNHAGTCVHAHPAEPTPHDHPGTRGSGHGSGACECDAPFHGEHCEQFRLYSYQPGSGGLSMPQGNATWGGSVVLGDDGDHHMYAAMMSGHGELSTWLSQSQIAHAVSKTGPQGPYVFAGVALAGRGGHHWDAVTCHNPDVKRTPEGLYIIYYMGSRGMVGATAALRDRQRALRDTRNTLRDSRRTRKDSHRALRDNQRALRENRLALKGSQRELRDNQRVGTAWSRSPYGPWQGRDVIVSPGPVHMDSQQ